MALVDTLVAVQTDLVASLQGLSQFVNLTFRSGAKSAEALDAPPRIVWVRGPATYAAAYSNSGRNPRVDARRFRTKELTVAAHVWAAKASGASGLDDVGADADCETLANALVASVYRVAVGSFTALSEEWPQTDWTTQGYLCVVVFRFEAPIVDLAPVTVTGLAIEYDDTSEPPSGELQAPGDV